MKNMCKLNKLEIKFFIFIFVVLTLIGRGQTEHGDMFDLDVVNDLKDTDLRLALNDLSLNDLKTLQDFIDYEEFKNMDYQQNGHVISEPKDLSAQAKQQAKMDEQMVMAATNDEYIKQLDYSFPPNEQQYENNSDGIDLRKPHVRVKRK